MKNTQTLDVWWKNAVFYCLDVARYQDSDGDGIGDFRGLTQRIEHLARLGVSCVWLMPFYPSLGEDDGYDIADYYAVDPRLGTLGDMVEMVRTAREHGIRVIVDLVVNHTSDQHPWFKESRSSKTNARRDWYVWSDTPQHDRGEGVMFPDYEDSIWTRDGRTRQHYRHRFLSSQPDLNIANPEVRDEIARIMGFWLQMGVSGFRVDAVPYLMDTDGSLAEADLPEPHDYLADLSSFVSRRSGDSVLLGEVNLEHEVAHQYFGARGEELGLVFDFVTNQALMLALARHDARPLRKALQHRPHPPQAGHWANFIRNHDELTLDKLDESEAEEVYQAFAPEEYMRAFDRGIRRRMPTMVGADPERLRCLYSLLFAMPGAPVLFYGEEIGMGENLEVDGRRAVRTPMQWAPGPHGGFSEADPKDWVCPMTEGAFGPDHVNVEDSRTDPESLMNWLTLVIHRRRQISEIGWGEAEVIDTSHDGVLALRCITEQSAILTIHSFVDEPIEVQLRVDHVKPGTVLRNVLSEAPAAIDTVTVEEDGTLSVTLPRYGAWWLRAATPVQQ